MVLLPDDYKRRKHKIREWGRAKTGQISPQGTAEIWEHWDGSRDATVKPAAFRVAMKADPAGDLSAEIAELEAAIRANEIARRSGDPGWHARTARRVMKAKERLQARG